MRTRPGLVTVVGTRGAAHCVSLYVVKSPGGGGRQVLSRCSCGWTHVTATGAHAELEAYAHIRAHEPT